MSQNPDEVPSNHGGSAEEVLKHLISDGFPHCIDTEHLKMDVVVDDEGVPKQLGGISFGDGSKLIAFSFDELARWQMEKAGAASD